MFRIIKFKKKYLIIVIILDTCKIMDKKKIHKLKNKIYIIRKIKKIFQNLKLINQLKFLMILKTP